jgi:hypothetical protein
MQTLVLWYLCAEARTTDPGQGTIVFEVDLADVTRTLSRMIEACEHNARQALEDLMGPESIIASGPPRLDILPCDGLDVPEHYRVVFFGDPSSVEPPDDRA